MKQLNRLFLALLAGVAATGSARAHSVFPLSLQLRPGETDYILVADAGSCPATITATSTNPNLLFVSAVNMSNGNVIGGGGATVTVPNRVNQVFVVTALPGASSGTAKIEICWVGSNYPNPPCNENNCNPYAPTSVDVTVSEAPGGLANALNSSWAADPVGMRDGELVFTESRDFALGGPLPLQVHRTYSSSFVDDGAPLSLLGPNWRHSLDWSLSLVGNNVEIWTDEGRLVRFEKGYLKSNWDLAVNQETAFQLVESGTEWILGDPRDDLVRTFNSQGQLTTIEDGRGNSHALMYTGGRLSTASDGMGRMLSFSYGGSPTRLISISDGTRSAAFGYTPSGQLATATDTNAETTTYSYDPGFPSDALLTARMLPEGNVPLTQTWDANKRVATQTDAFGNVWNFAFGLPGGVSSVTTPSGNTTQHEHSAGGGLTGWTDPANNQVSLAYDAAGNRRQVTDRFGDRTSNAFDPISGKPTVRTEANGAKRTLSYTTRTFKGIALRDLSRITAPGGRQTNFNRDAVGNLLSLIQSSGATWSFTYNSYGEVLTATSPAGGTTTFTYGTLGELTSITDDSGSTTTLAYDPLVRLSLVTFDDGSTAQYTYDQRDNILTTTDGLGRVWTNTHNHNGNLLSLTGPDGGKTDFCWDNFDRLCGVTNPLAKTTTATYDIDGFLLSLTDPKGNEIFFGYNGFGELTSIEDQAGKTWSQTFGPEGIPTSRTSPRGHTETFASDDLGRFTSRTSPLGRITQLAWNGENQITQRRDALGRNINFGFDSDGNPDDVSLPINGLSTMTHFNGLGQRTLLTGPNNSSWSWQVDSQGNQTTATDPLGRATTYTYDSDNNPATADFPGPLSGTYTYDVGNRPTRLAFSDGLNLDYQWDVNDRLEIAANFTATRDLAGKITDSNGIGATYDDNGLLASLTYGPGKVVSYDYFPTNKLKTVTDWIGGVTNFGYDEAGHKTSHTRPNGLGTDYTYDDDGAMNWLQHRGFVDITLTRDATHRITMSESNWPTNGLPALGSKSSTYDAAYQINGLSWSPRGELLVDGNFNYTWNGAGHLETYDDGVDVHNFEYDGLGQITGDLVRGLSYEFVTTYQTKQPAVAIEREGGADLAYNIFTPDGTLLHQIDATTSQRYYPLYDENYSTRIVVDEARTTVATFDYSPWGKVTAQTGSFDFRFKWRGVGGYMAFGELNYNRGRFLDSGSGRYLSPTYGASNSPLATSPYQMNGSNPLNYGDSVRSAWDYTGFGGQTPTASEFRFGPTLANGAPTLANEVRTLPAVVRRIASHSFVDHVRTAIAVSTTDHHANHRKAVRKFIAGLEFARALRAEYERSLGRLGNLSTTSVSPTSLLTAAGVDSFDWGSVTPRLGLTYSLGEKWETLVSPNLGQYADGLGTSQVTGDLYQLGHVGYFEFGGRSLTSDPRSGYLNSDLTNSGGIDGMGFLDPRLDASSRRDLGGDPRSNGVLYGNGSDTPRQVFVGARFKF